MHGKISMYMRKRVERRDGAGGVVSVGAALNSERKSLSKKHTRGRPMYIPSVCRFRAIRGLMPTWQKNVRKRQATNLFSFCFCAMMSIL
jgi:hypothetical protein